MTSLPLPRRRWTPYGSGSWEFFLDPALPPRYVVEREKKCPVSFHSFDFPLPLPMYVTPLPTGSPTSLTLQWYKVGVIGPSEGRLKGGQPVFYFDSGLPWFFRLVPEFVY